MARKLLWASLALAPITFVVDFGAHAGDVALFVLAAISLVPLAWLIGEATEHAAEHTGPGVGGFLNASFGNAPELIISLFAIGDALPDVVRGSLAGSVVSNILLVLGVAIVTQGQGEGNLDRRSLLVQLGLVGGAIVLLLIPAVPGFHGDPNRHSVAIVTIPVAIVLLVVYMIVTTINLRQHRAAHDDDASTDAWPFKTALIALIAATAATAIVSEILVHSLEAFAHAAHLSEFFIAAVIVALVGNAAEHGGAIVIAHRGKIKLATEIAVASSAQVALFVMPAVALLSWAVGSPLTFAFRPAELIAMAVAVAAVAFVLHDARARRVEGFALIAVYAGVAAAFYIVGDR